MTGVDVLDVARRAAIRKLSGDEVAALRDQRDFLLRSLDDLEAEHAAGDVDDHDYEVLRDDYTGRAAQVIRALERHEARQPEGSARRWGWRRVAVVAGVVAFAAGAGLLVAQTAGRRTAGETVTGDIRTTTRTEVARAGDLLNQGAYEDAVSVYEDVLAEQPEHVEAMTYKGWAEVLSGQVETGVVTLNAAVELEPAYPDAHAFLVVTYYRLAQGVQGEPELEGLFLDRARGELRTLDELDVPAAVDELLAGIRAELDGDGP